MDIKVKNIKKSYGSRTVLCVDSLNFEKGKIHGILGPNGSGKSTFMKILAGLEEKDSGKVTYDGLELNSEIMKSMTYSEQSSYLLRRTVFENIAYPLIIRRINKEMIYDRVNEIMDKFEIYKLKDQIATKLSGGESQKVALARAMVFEPKLLILDEPTANIDPNSTNVIEKNLIELNDNIRTTILIVTHNIAQCSRVSHNTVFMENGEIIECGKTDKVLASSQNIKTRKFMELEYDYLKGGVQYGNVQSS